jgi:A/G-specific adenine glycosylase
MSRVAATPHQPDPGKFRRLLLQWYTQHQRKLPWRGESDPYRILVSEIMLQQTRVAVVEDRYKKFVAQFPTVESLARAREQTVLASWSGLGYYRRARNLHAAAKQIAKTSGFPRTAETLRELPGIGRYTANAVASIAFGEPVAVVDGNVKRVLERVTGRDLSEEQYWQAAGMLLAVESPGDFNQGMMELGAVICLPGKPICNACPVIELCASRGVQMQRERATRNKAVLKYSLWLRNGSVLLQQRDQTHSLMPGMWELPMYSEKLSTEKRLATQPLAAQPLMKLKHSITTTDYSVLVFAGKSRKGQWVPLRNAERFPLTGLTRKILRKLEERPS